MKQWTAIAIIQGSRLNIDVAFETNPSSETDAETGDEGELGIPKHIGAREASYTPLLETVVHCTT